MNIFKTRSILERILLRIQDFRSNITFSLSIQRSLKECMDNLEPSFQDKEYLTMMKESILANSDLMALIMNNSKDNFYRYYKTDKLTPSIRRRQECNRSTLKGKKKSPMTLISFLMGSSLRTKSSICLCLFLLIDRKA